MLHEDFVEGVEESNEEFDTSKIDYFGWIEEHEEKQQESKNEMKFLASVDPSITNVDSVKLLTEKKLGLPIYLITGNTPANKYEKDYYTKAFPFLFVLRRK